MFEISLQGLAHAPPQRIEYDAAAEGTPAGLVANHETIADQRDYPAVKAMAASQDYIEGPKAFSEKRPPKWVGK